MAWNKEQRALAKQTQKALFSCAIDGKHIKDSKFSTGAYSQDAPVDEELARAMFFFTLDIVQLDKTPAEAFKARFGKLKSRKAK